MYSGLYQQLQTVSDTTNALQNAEWSKISFGKFMMMMSSLDRNVMMGSEFDINHLSHLVFDILALLVSVVFHDKLGLK